MNKQETVTWSWHYLHCLQHLCWFLPPAANWPLSQSHAVPHNAERSCCSAHTRQGVKPAATLCYYKWLHMTFSEQNVHSSARWHYSRTPAAVWHIHSDLQKLPGAMLWDHPEDTTLHTKSYYWWGNDAISLRNVSPKVSRDQSEQNRSVYSDMNQINTKRGNRKCN